MDGLNFRLAGFDSSFLKSLPLDSQSPHVPVNYAELERHPVVGVAGVGHGDELVLAVGPEQVHGRVGRVEGLGDGSKERPGAGVADEEDGEVTAVGAGREVAWRVMPQNGAPNRVPQVDLQRLIFCGHAVFPYLGI